MRVLFSAIIVICLLGGFNSCHDDAEGAAVQELSIANEKVSVKMGENRYIAILSGNDGYSASSSDERILSVSIDGDQTIKLQSNDKGTATVFLKDKLDKQISFLVVVEDPYLIIEFGDQAIQYEVDVNNFELKSEIVKDLVQYVTIESNTIYEFFANEDNALLVYQNKKGLVDEEESKKGTYTFEEGVGVRFTFDDQSTVYTENGSGILSMIQQYLDRSRISRKMSPPVFLVLSEDFTDKYSEKYPHAGIKKVSINYSAKPKAYKEY